ncbi:MAG: hypothetical protein L6R45_22010 [Anaerolineae bacterium]|nr:hypothetical protein [Anaerolineae bacterium]
MTHSVFYLKLPNGAQFPVEVVSSNGGLLVQGTDRIDLCFELTPAEAEARPAGRGQAGRKTLNPLSMTPVDVAAYFEQSPILCIYAEDVRTAVLSPSKATQSVLQLQQDLQTVQGLENPTQADIAERLFGDRQKTGGAYRRRILAVLGATTTSIEAGSEGRTVGKAA